MKLQLLPTGQMIPLGQALVGQQGALLKSSPLIQAWMAEVEAKQAAMEQVYVRYSAEELQAPSKEAARDGDTRHDHCVLAFYKATDAAIHHYTATGNTELVGLLARARDVVLPDGAAQVKKAWLQESGEGPTRAASLDDTLRAALSGVPVFGGTLMDLVEAYVAACLVLGHLLHRRSVTTAVEDASPTLGPVRAGWVNTFLFLFELVERSTLSPAQKAEIIAPFADAVASQERRLSERTATAAADG